MPIRATLLAGFTAFFSTALVAAIYQTTGRGGIALPDWLLIAGGNGIVAIILAAVFVYLGVGRRLAKVASFLEAQALGEGLERLPPLGPGSMGRIALAANALAASKTSLQVDVIDQRRELDATQQELRLKAQLADVNERLERRLQERALLFDILRISASGGELSHVLDELVGRLGDALGLREFAILLRGSGDHFTVRSLYGFESPDKLRGRSIRIGEGVSGEVAAHLEPIVIDDVSEHASYLAFWNQAPREGSFASFPILHHGKLIGLLALTRPAERPMQPVELQLIKAVANQLAVAIRHVEVIDELKQLSTHDDLTGLCNRRLLYRRLEMEMARAQRFEHALGVLFVDVDHFKQLNDQNGHSVGDAALRGLAAIMTQTVRQVDTVARIGGEEFAVLLPRATLEDAMRIADQLRMAVEASQLPGAEGQPEGRLTVSIGVAQFSIGEPEERLLQRADAALYRAKASGRNRVESLDAARSRKDSGFVRTDSNLSKPVSTQHRK